MSRVNPGLQTERTVLAWRRSTLSFAAVSVIIARRALADDGTATTFLGITTLALATWLALGSLRVRIWTTPHPDEPRFPLVKDGRVPVAFALVLTALCITVLLMTLRS